MGLLDSGAWHGKIYSSGWTEGSGGDYPVTEPATGAELGRIGRATPADVRAAARRAREAQPAWAAVPYGERAAGTEYGLSLGILTRDVYRGLEIAERIPSGLVHINDQTVADEATIPFGGVGASGNGGRLGGPRANLEAFTETQWVTIHGDLPAYPF